MVYRRKDAFYVQAKEQGLRSRAAWKLDQLQERYHIIHRGDRVVDLGAWPGGWLQVSARCVGRKGKVVGVDLLPVPPLPESPQVQTLQADIMSPALEKQVADALGGAADVVLCDVAPKLTGIRERDWAQAHKLCERAIELAESWLRRGGTLVIKLFMNPEWKRVVGQVRKLFQDVQTTRPEATRKGSAELYLIARGYRGRQKTESEDLERSLSRCVEDR